MTQTRGLLIDGLDNEYSQTIVRIMAEYCRPRGISLVVFTLGTWGAELDQAEVLNQLLSLATGRSLSQLLVCSAQLSSRGLLTLVERQLSQKHRYPVVSLGGPMAGYPCVVLDVRPTLRLLLDHLWHDHGYRRFAWVSGPRRNRESQERERVLLDYLAEKKTTLHPSLWHEGNFQISSGRAAGRALAQNRPDWDVVVAANDLMALGLQEILGASAPVTGFDNGSASQFAGLTTVDPKLASQVQTLLGVRGQDAEAQLVEGQLVIRRSCGCLPSVEPSPQRFVAADQFGERMGDLGASIEGSVDHRALAECLDAVLPSEGIHYWKLIPPQEPDRIPGPPLSALPFEVVVHTLSRGRRPGGFLVLDLGNRDYFLSEWLRQSVSRLVETWQRKAEEAEVQKILSLEVAKLVHAKKDFEEVVNGLPLWIMEVDRHWHLRYVNHAARNLLGLAPGTGRHDSLLRFLGGADQERALARLKSCLNTGELTGCDFQFVRPDGTSVPVIAQLEPLAAERSRTLASFFGSLSFEGGVRLTGLEVGPIVEGVIQPEQLIFKHYTFSNREKDVILRLSKGMSILEMAEELVLSQNTVKGYMHDIYTKTGVRNRREFFAVMESYQRSSVESNSLTQVLVSRMLAPRRKFPKTNH